MEWNMRWGDLAQYNTEKAHGIVHTPEYDRLMAEKKVRFNDERREDMRQRGYELVDQGEGYESWNLPKKPSWKITWLMGR
jgi:hypothetical protein